MQPTSKRRLQTGLDSARPADCVVSPCNSERGDNLLKTRIAPEQRQDADGQ